MAQDLKQIFDYNLPAAPATSDPDLYKELLVIYNSVRLVADAIERRNKRYIVFEGTGTLNRAINIYNPGGVPTARLAQHGVTECHGFVSIAANAGQVGEITLFGLLESAIGAVAGQKYWLSTTAGNITTINPGAGSQRVGFGLSSTEIWAAPMLLPT